MQSFEVLKELLGSTYMPYLDIKNILEENITWVRALRIKQLSIHAKTWMAPPTIKR